MNRTFQTRLVVTLLAVGMLGGCASTKKVSDGRNPNLITREEIRASGAINLYEAVSRLRPQWLNVGTTKSFSLDNEIVVFQDDAQLGGTDALRQLGAETAYQIRYMDGVRAAAALPGLMSGRHIEGVIVVDSRDPSGG